MPTVIVSTGAVMVTLGSSALNTALPTLATTFNVPPSTISWVVIAYALASAVFLTVFGRLSDMIGRKRPYLVGMSVVLVSTILAGFSHSVGELIFWRVVQGIGGAMTIANSVAYLVEIYPPSRRGFIVGAFEGFIAIGLGVGPVLGGLLLDAFGWSSVFFVQVPFALAILLLTPKFMYEKPRIGGTARGFDIAGALLFAGAISPLMFGLTMAPTFGYTSPLIIACFLASPVFLATFIVVEKRVKEPMVDLGLFSSAAFSAGNVAKACGYFGFAANAFLLPFYWDRALGFPPAQLGMVLTAYPIGMLFGSVVCGPLSDKVGTRLLATGGMLMLCGSALFQIFVDPAWGAFPMFVSAALAGFGTGAFIAPNDSAILSVVPHNRLGVANSIMSLARNIGSLLGSAIAAGLLSARLIANDQAFVPSYQQAFLAVAIVTLAGAALAWVRDPNAPEGPAVHL